MKKNAALHLRDLEPPLHRTHLRFCNRVLREAPPDRWTHPPETGPTPARSRPPLMPSLASYVGLGDRESAALSNWRNNKTSGARAVANSMATLYDQSTVQTQFTSKYVCTRSLADALAHFHTYNLSWNECSSKMAPEETYREDLFRAANNGDSKAAEVLFSKIESFFCANAEIFSALCAGTPTLKITLSSVLIYAPPRPLN